LRVNIPPDAQCKEIVDAAAQVAPDEIARLRRVARILASAQDRRKRRKAKHKPKVFQIDLREMINLQRQANEMHNILVEHMNRSALIPERDRVKTDYCWKCGDKFPMSELIEDDDPYIKDEDDPNDKNYQCRPCAEADEEDAGYEAFCQEQSEL